MGKIAIGALALVLGACSQPSERAVASAPPAADGDATASGDGAAVATTTDPPAGERATGDPPVKKPPVAKAGVTPVAKIRQLVATPIAAPMSKAPKGLYDALVSKGKRWELRNDDGNELIIETHAVRKIGKARVARLRWISERDGEKSEHEGGWPRLVIVKKSGLVVLSGYQEDSEIGKLAKTRAHYANPPRLNQKGKSYYAHLHDDMVCLGFDFWAKQRAEEDVCGDESCVWRFCLGPDGIVGAGVGGANTYSPPTFVLASMAKSRRVGVMFSASSEHKKWKHYRFTADQLGDRDLATSWQPAKGKAVGEWLEVWAGHADSPPLPMTVDAIEIANGFQTKDKLGDLFAANARARQLTIAVDGKAMGVVELGEQQRGYVRIPVGGVRAETVRITIDSVWPGKKWQDVAISEVAIIGRYK